MEGPPPDSDEQFAEWYVWAKREVSSDRRVCLGVAQAAVEALSSGADRETAEAAARKSVAGTAVILLPKVSPWRQGYAQWYDWARLDFGGEPSRLHRITRVAIERLKTDGDAGQAADAARAAAAADPPAPGTDAGSTGTAGASWSQGGSGTGGGWGGNAFSGSSSAIGTGTVLAASAPGVAGAPAFSGAQRAPLASGPPRPVTFERVAYAGFGRRLAATFIDAILGAIGVVLVYILFDVFVIIAEASTQQAPNGLLIILALLVILAVVFWVYDAGLESSPAQATLGKRAVGLVVLDKYGRRVSFARATARHFIKFVPWFLGLIALYLGVPAVASGFVNELSVGVLAIGVVFLACAAVEFLLIALTRERRGLHDLIAGTRVVRRQMLSRVVPAATVPPPPQTVPDARPGVPAGAARPAGTPPRHR